LWEVEGEHRNMSIMELAAEPRTAVGKGLRSLRDAGYVPAVLYGHGVSSLPIQVSERSLERLLADGGANTLVNLSITDTDEVHTVLVREIQRYPTRPKVLHLDLYKVLMTEKIQASVPLVIVGKSRALTEGMAAMVQSLDDVEIECLPGDLPSSLHVDISGLVRTDQHILVRDIPLPEGVELMSDPAMVVISLVPARVVEEEAAEVAGAPTPEEVEVVAKGKAAKAAELGEEEE
jgi:large subunit ribosomal protein L25